LRSGYRSTSGTIHARGHTTEPAALSSSLQNLVNAMITDADGFSNTAIVITMDKGGGYYDSGYTQPLDFFGDGTRIFLLVV
jgi:hypothetical protein